MDIIIFIIDNDLRHSDWHHILVHCIISTASKQKVPMSLALCHEYDLVYDIQI